MVRLKFGAAKALPKLPAMHIMSALLLLISGGTSAAAQSQSNPMIEQMRTRDRRAKPEGELSAWSGFAAPILADTGSPAPLRAELRLRLAIARYYAKDYAKGWEEAQASAALMAADAPLAAELAAYQALLLTDLSRYDEAKSYADKAFAMVRGGKGEASGDIAIVYNAQAMLYYAKGDYAAATRAMCLSSDRAQAHLPPTNSLVASSMLACGIFRYNMDDDDAWDIMRAAATMAYANLPRDNTVVAMALNGSGGALMQLGRFAEAEDIIRREIEVERAIYGNDDINVYYPLSLLARLQELQGKLEDAEATFRQAADFIHRVSAEGSNPELRGNSWVNLGIVLEKRGDLAGALAMQQRALAELKAQLKPDHESIPQAERHVARLLSLTGRTAEALPLARDSAARMTAILGAGHRATIGAQTEYARALDRVGRTDEAFIVAKAAAALLETRQLDLATKRSDMVSFSQIMARGFSDYAYIALRAGQYEAAVRAAQLASLSELSLVNAELSANALARDKGLSTLIEELRTQRAAERTAQSGLAQAEGAGSGDALAIGRTLAATRAAIAQIETRIAGQFPDYAALTRPAPVSLATIQARLTGDQAMIIPLSLADRFATITVTQAGVQWAEAAGSNRDIAGYVAAIRASIDAARGSEMRAPAPFDARAAHALYRALLPGSLEMAVAGKRNWLFASNGPLASLPAALLLTRLPARGEPMQRYPWLVRDHAVSIFTSFNDGARAPSSNRPPRFLGVGAPILALGDNSLPPLPKAADELTALSSALGGNDNVVLTGADATRDKVLAAGLARYSVIAFATHGLTSGERNGLREPALVLSPAGIDADGRDDDGLLTAGEISKLSIPADWVILSACNSGAGRNASAPTYSGLAQAFRLAGTRSMLLSHWPVRDDAAALLTVGSVRGAAEGLSRPEALRRAMLSLIGNRAVPGAAHPAIWAPFILIED